MIGRLLRTYGVYAVPILSFVLVLAATLWLAAILEPEAPGLSLRTHLKILEPTQDLKVTVNVLLARLSWYLTALTFLLFGLGGIAGSGYMIGRSLADYPLRLRVLVFAVTMLVAVMTFALPDTRETWHKYRVVWELVRQVLEKTGTTNVLLAGQWLDTLTYAVIIFELAAPVSRSPLPRTSRDPLRSTSWASCNG